MIGSRWGLTGEQQWLLDMADKFGQEKLWPLADKMDHEEWWPPEIFAELGSNGMLGATVAPEYGGAGMGYLEAGLITQGFARWNHAIALGWMAHDNLCANNIALNGSAELKAKYLPRMTSGEYVGCLALTEPGAGSDALGSMRTRAERDGDGFRLNGSKIYITNGPIADVCLVYAKTQPDQGSKGITAFLVETAQPGFQVARKLVKMGFRGSQTAELFFDDVGVPAANIVGELHQGHRVVMAGLDFERAMVAPLALGIAERALDLSVDYVKHRRQFGTPIADFQMIRSRVADMYTDIEAARALCWGTLARCDVVDEATAGRGEIHAQTAAAVYFCAEVLHRVLDHALQVHGGFGYMWETEINRLYRAIKLLEIGAGTTEVRKMIIADELLGRPGRSS